MSDQSDWVESDAYTGPERRSERRVAEQHLADTISAALQEIVSLGPKVEDLGHSVEQAQVANRENLTRIRWLAALFALNIVGIIVTFVVQSQVKSTQGDVESLVGTIEGCINPGGECYETSTQRSREAFRNLILDLSEGPLTVQCLLLIDPAARTEGTLERCEEEAAGKRALRAAELDAEINGSEEGE